MAKDVDSSAWDLKSWAALKYYSQNFQEGRCFGINTFYVIGDSDTQPIPYDETKQGNKAHFAELIAVTAIKHFNKVVQNGQGGGTLNPWNFYNTEWAQNISSDLDKKCWGTDLAEEIKCLANFYAFGKFFMMMREDRFYPVNKVFYKKISKDNNLIDRFAVLEDFIFSSKENQDSFVKWLGEMRESKRSFTAVNTDDVAYDSACNTFKFSPSTPNVVYNGVDTHIDVTMSDYFKTINDAYRKSLKVKDQTDKVVKFLNMCYDGIAKVNKVNE